MKNIKIRLFIQSVFPAPYRVGVFKRLSEEFEIFVVFERNNDKNRSGDWFVLNFGFDGIILDNAEAVARYKQELTNLRTYDAVLAYDYSSVSSMKLMLRCIRLYIPYFINCDGAFVNRHAIKDLVKRFFITRARACLSSGVYAENYFLTYGAKKENIYRHNFTSLYAKDILNEPISYEEKKRIREELGLPVDKKVVISVGQFAHRKGYDILLKAWRKIDVDADLILIGGGEKEQEYKKYIKENNINNVTIEGFKNKDEVFNYLKVADLFVLPTREDIWGLVINEAMACGLPIITTEKCIAGLELIINYENGFIVPIERVDILAERIEEVMSDEKLAAKMAAANLEKIKPYTVENMAIEHFNILAHEKYAMDIKRNFD